MVSWNFSFGPTFFTNGLSTALRDSVMNLLIVAGDTWSRYLGTSPVTIEVKVEVRDLGDTTLAQAGPNTSVSAGGGGVFRDGVTSEIITGFDPNFSEPDGSLDIDLDSLKNGDFFLDPFPLERTTPVPFGQFDLLTVLIHEIGHILGFVGFDPGTSVFETFVTGSGANRVFNGPNVVAEFGSPPRLDDDSAHFDQTLVGQSIMTPFISNGAREFITPLDIAVLADLGIDVARPTSGADVIFGFENTVQPTLLLLGGDDVYHGFGVPDSVSGGAGNDTLDGGGGNDVLFGSSGNDRLIGGAGHDVLKGAHGDADVAVFSGNFADYEIDLEAGTIRDLRIGSPDGTDRFFDIEFFEFADQTVEVANLGVQGGLTIIGTSADETLIGGSFNDQIDGSGGNDLIRGGGGDDMLLGGAGVNTLQGQSGADIYIIEAQATQTKISDNGDGDQSIKDRIVFQDVQSVKDLVVDRGGSAGDSLVLSDVAGGNSVFVFRHFNAFQPFRRIEEVEFADGSVYSLESDLTGGAENDLLAGSPGNDLVKGGGGDDALLGGAGVNTLQGQSGADIYIIEAQATQTKIADNGDVDQSIKDRIVFQDLQSVRDLAVDRGGSAGDSLLLSDAAGGNSVFIFRHFNAFQPFRRIEEVEFADGSVFSLESDLTGDGENDIIVGSSANETIAGLGGDDALFGGGGEDFFSFMLGDGADLILDFDAVGNDKIELGGFGEAFDTFTEVFNASSQVGQDLVIDFGGGDTLTLVGVDRADFTEDDVSFLVA